jgi:uncharacterized protein DUF4386
MTAASAQTYARVAGVLLFVSVVCGGFGEAFVPSQLVTPDARTTADNILQSDLLFRLAFVAYLVEAVCDIALALVFYVLLRPVNREVALLAAFFGLIATATFAGTELFYFAPALILGGAGYLKTFSADQLDALALLSIRLYALGSGLFSVFYGVRSGLFGYLMFRSGYLPAALGALLALSGLGFIIQSLVLSLSVPLSSTALLAPTFLAILALTGWLLLKGIDVAKWEAEAGRR